jgi:hypothetical protein
VPATPSETPQLPNTTPAAPVSIVPVDLPIAAAPSAAQIPSSQLCCPWRFPSRLGAGLSQGLQKQHPILVILEHRFTPVTTIHHVVDGPSCSIH